MGVSEIALNAKSILNLGASGLSNWVDRIFGLGHEFVIDRMGQTTDA